MQNLLTDKNLVASPIQEGDAGIILKPDGTFQVFSTGDLNGGNFTETQIEQGRKLMGLAAALAVPEVLETLIRMSQDPRIAGAPGVAMGAHSVQ